MEEALYETIILRQFSGPSLERIPDDTTIFNFRRLLSITMYHLLILIEFGTPMAGEQFRLRNTPVKPLAHLSTQLLLS